MYQSTPNWDTPKSCSRVPRVHSAAVCWYSPTPMRLPASSRASPMPESVWTYSAMCMKRRDGNTGMATMSWPRDLAMSREDMDISATSNSPNLSCRQKVFGRVRVAPYEVHPLHRDGTVEERGNAFVCAGDQAEFEFFHGRTCRYHTDPSPSGRGWLKAGSIRPKPNPSPSGRGWPKAGLIRPKSNPSPFGRGWPKAGLIRPKPNPSPSGRGWPKAGSIRPQTQPLSLWERVAEGRVRAPQQPCPAYCFLIQRAACDGYPHPNPLPEGEGVGGHCQRKTGYSGATHAVRMDGSSGSTGSQESPRSRVT